jgi:hypothetical protein
MPESVQLFDPRRAWADIAETANRPTPLPELRSQAEHLIELIDRAQPPPRPMRTAEVRHRQTPMRCGHCGGTFSTAYPCGRTALDLAGALR